MSEIYKQLVDKGLNLCGCIGPINGQPYCPCKMTRLDKEQIKLVDAVGSESCQINLSTVSKIGEINNGNK